MKLSLFRRIRIMNVRAACLFLLINLQVAFAGEVQLTYTFHEPIIERSDAYCLVYFDGCSIYGEEGKASLPLYPVKLLLPPGEIAASIEIQYSGEKVIEGHLKLMPRQPVRPVSAGFTGMFLQDDDFYNSSEVYPGNRQPDVSTHFLNGYGIAVSAFCPLRYVPASGTVSYYQNVTVTIHTAQDPQAEARGRNYHPDPDKKLRLGSIVQNPEELSMYPLARAFLTDEYDYLIITDNDFRAAFDTLIRFYQIRGYKAKVSTIEHIDSVVAGADRQARIRNHILDEYQNHDIGYVLLGGDVEVVPYRGLYCQVLSGGSYYTDYGIPADLYYSALDGTWDDNGNGIWGETSEDDLYPEIAVGRLTFNTEAELQKILHKIFSYQANPVQGELTRSLLAGEHLYSNPLTYGSDYLQLLVGYRTDNGYTTQGIPPSQPIDTLYDEWGTWSDDDLIARINSGKPWVHHCGHSNYTYAMRMSNSDITNANFSGANGIAHNYVIVYTHGCMCGGFDQNDCIAEKMTGIDNFAVAFIGNSRYGWFNEGQTDGPSTHLHREFVDAIYRDSLFHAGDALMRSKAETAPFVDLSGEWEAGATRWCFYDNNLLGDPLMALWTEEPFTVMASYDHLIRAGADSVVVQLDGTGTSFKGYRCALIQNDTLYGSAVTDASGRAVIHPDGTIKCGSALLTVSGFNLLTQFFALDVADYWLGYTADWNDPVNWFSGQIPSSSSCVIIPGNPVGTKFPLANSGNQRCCKLLFVESGVNFRINAGETFSIYGK